MTTAFPPKEITCDCGRTQTISMEADWCEKCANRIFYHEKHKNRYKWHTYYMYGIIISVFTFLAYVFMELIAKPFL